MKIYSVSDPEFRAYGRILDGYDTAELITALEEETPLPENVVYVPSEPALERQPAMAQIRDQVYGGMPVQLGWCNGHNTKLNCLEYHRDSEINLGSRDFILLLGLESDIVGGVLDTATVKAFRCPAGTMVEIYATTLHYAPCEAAKDQGFRVLIALPLGTNSEKPAYTPRTEEDTWLTARNRWLLAHAESDEARQGAHIGLRGINIDLADAI